MRPDAGSPADWIRFALSDLSLAESRPEGVLLETLCFHAQQAVEKSLKAILVATHTPPPKTHNLKILLDLLPKAVPIPADVAASAELTEYAVAMRYPGEWEYISDEDYEKSIRLAEVAVQWAKSVLRDIGAI